MKSITQKRNEANERAARRAQLSTEQKLISSIANHSVHGGIETESRESIRLRRQLLAETNQAKLNGKVVVPSSKCEARKR